MRRNGHCAWEFLKSDQFCQLTKDAIDDLISNCTVFMSAKHSDGKRASKFEWHKCQTHRQELVALIHLQSELEAMQHTDIVLRTFHGSVAHGLLQLDIRTMQLHVRVQDMNDM